MKFTNRVKHSWNAFTKRDPTNVYTNYGISNSRSLYKSSVFRNNEKSLVAPVYNRIAMDVASIDIVHCVLDDNNRYLKKVDSEFNNCLSLSANIDQTGRTCIQDMVESMLDEGVIALLPTETEGNPFTDEDYDIYSMRVGKIVEWYPRHVKVDVYNDNTGKHEELIRPKDSLFVIENPFYSIMNEKNSTAQRLISKLKISDMIDENNGANRLDMIIQLPYTIKTAAKKEIAEQRKKDIEVQLSTSKLGIAYIDSTEHITQLNRPIENNMQAQIEYLMNMFYSQLGITVEILNGTADDKVMSNYYSRLIEPILSVICDEFKRKYLSKEAIKNRHESIEFFRDPFKLVPVSEIAEIADKFTRNAIMTANELRQIVGMKPASDPRADELRNKNLSEAKGEQHLDVNGNNITDAYGNPEMESESKSQEQ